MLPGCRWHVDLDERQSFHRGSIAASSSAATEVIDVSAPRVRDILATAIKAEAGAERAENLVRVARNRIHLTL